MIGYFFFSRKEYVLNLESLDGNITVQVLIHANDILPVPFTAFTSVLWKVALLTTNMIVLPNVLFTLFPFLVILSSYI